jgi:uncharacterized protein (TIGR02001 family)
MKNVKVLTLAAAVASAFMGTNAMAELTGNIGLSSQYYFRGVQQTVGAAASAGADYAHASGAYAGIWASDVGGHGAAGAADGIEIDYYFGYGGEASGVAYSVGYTLYVYTGNFDTEYGEINLSAGYGPANVAFSSGTRDVPNGVDEDYTFTTVGYEYGSLSATYNIWGGDFEGAYLDVSFAKEISEIDFAVTLINGDAEENPAVGSRNVATDGTALIFTIGKSFAL